MNVEAQEALNRHVKGCRACDNAYGFCEEGFRLLRVATTPEVAEPSQLRLVFAEFANRPLVRAYIEHRPAFAKASTFARATADKPAGRPAAGRPAMRDQARAYRAPYADA